MEKTSYRRNPILRGDIDLFQAAGEVSELTPEQEVDSFITRWMQIMNPFVEYQDYFNGKSKDSSINMRLVKELYKNFVVEDEWDEQKYVMCLDSLFKAHRPLHSFNLEFFGKLYGEGKLDSQMAVKKRSRRRRRV